MHEDRQVLEAIKARFRLRKWRMPKAIAVQSQVPDGAMVLPNSHGTAPGLALSVERGGTDVEREALSVERGTQANL